ncbi:MAG: hypothetical protein AABY07_02640 [Nanoarchaeota archaeon]
MIVHNKADRDAGELQDIIPEEVNRLAKEFSKLSEKEKESYYE